MSDPVSHAPGQSQAERLSQGECLRYSRHLALAEIGVEGQLRLKASRVLIVGVGGLGSPASLYLAAAGVGKITLLDEDRVSLSNLQRQVLYATSQQGEEKAFAARHRLASLNPEITIEARAERLNAAIARELVAAHDLILDATDNFPSRYLLNDACVLEGKPLAFGAITRFDGQATLFAPGGPCYRCLYPHPPERSPGVDCESGGVLGVLPGLVGLIQATEALKWLLKIGSTLQGRLLVIDALKMSFDSFVITRRSDCPLCAENPVIRELHEIPPTQACASPPQLELTCDELRERLALQPGGLLLVDLRAEDEHRLGQIPGSRRFSPAELEERALDLSFRDEIVVYCRSGLSSARAAARLRQLGFQNAFSLRGGFSAWKTAKLTESSCSR